jgi:hypothetical protein
MHPLIKLGVLQGVIRIPIETDLEFQRAFSGPFQRLPFRLDTSGRETHAIRGTLSRLGIIDLSNSLSEAHNWVKYGRYGY